MALRKLTYAPNDERAPPPSAEINKNGIKLDASLGKEVTNNKALIATTQNKATSNKC